jgi:1-Cys peroxiredoxin 6
MKQDELHGMDCLIAHPLDPIKSHKDWLRDVVAHCENKIEVKFLSLLIDADRAISTAYGMIDASTSDEQPRP